MKLLLQAILKFSIGLLLVGALLFLPAGGFDFWNGWLFVGLLFVPMLFLGIVLFCNAPDLLAKRLNAKETESTQRSVVALSALIFMGGFIVAGLDFRFGWSYGYVPQGAVIAASGVLLVSYALYAEVMRENVYLSRTVEVQAEQRVIDKGLYGVVRHPMYAVTLWLFLAMPVVLGSWWALAVFALYIPVIVVRIVNEERVLTAGLDGYAAYKARVKFRLVPFIW